MLISRFFFYDDFLGPNPVVWDWKTKNLAREVLQKATFTDIGFLMAPGSVFHDFGWLFMISAALVLV